MRRFEFKEGSSHKFWEIVVEGNAFTVRYGKVGTDGQVQTKTFKDAAKAEAEAQKKIAEKTKKGYTEVAAPAGAAGKSPAAAKAGARNAELEQAIHDAPDDVGVWQVYADWLQGQGDPWGERLSLGIAHAAAKGAQKTKLKKALDAYDAEHREELLGKSFAKMVEAEDFEQVAKLEWTYGFVTSVRAALPEFEWEGSNKPDSVLRALVKSPAARFLQSITIGMVTWEGDDSLEQGVDAISKAGALPSVRSLFVGDFEYPEDSEISWVEAGDVESAMLVMPNLRSLHVRGGSIGFGKVLEHDKLEELKVETGGLPSSTVKAIGKCKLPNLTKMEVWFGQKNYGGDGNIKMLAPLFTGEGVPKLRHLGLMNAEFTDDIAAALAKSKLLAQLESVDLSMGTLRDAGGQAILAAADKFKHLKSLNLDHNYLSDDVAKALQKALGKKVNIGERRTPYNWGDEDHYYTQIGE